MILNVVRASFTRPPTDHPARSRSAGSTFTRAAGVVNRRDFIVSQRVISEFELIDQAVEIGGAAVLADEQIVRSRKDRRSIECVRPDVGTVYEKLHRPGF